MAKKPHHPPYSPASAIRKRPDRQPDPGPRAIDLLEESVHRLRRTPPAAWSAYLCGTGTFLFAFLFFWAEMSRSAFADQQLLAWSGVVTLAFFGMKFGQSLFAALIPMPGAPPAGDSVLPAIMRSVPVQLSLQPWGLVLLPIAALATLPFPIAAAYFLNLSVLAGVPSPGCDSAGLDQRARRCARLWVRQNAIITSILALAAVVVFLNWVMVLFLVPRLLRSWIGWETVFSQAGLSLFNSTFFALAGGLTYLCLDPLARSVYRLRCFYAESLTTGDDLRPLFRRKHDRLESNTLHAVGPPDRSSQRGSPPGRFSRSASVVAAMALFVALLPSSLAAGPDTPAAPRAGPEIEQWNTAIDETLTGTEFRWRMPREREPGIATTTSSFLAEVFETLAEWVWRIQRWLRNLFPDRAPGAPGPSASTLQSLLQLLAYGLILVAGIWIVWLLVHHFRIKRRARDTAPVAPEPDTPDVADESIRADALPANEWLLLARDLAGRNELRLALRAAFLAHLAELAEQRFIRIRATRSNQDYLRDLQRRAHIHPQMAESFARHRIAFERVWYGRHPAVADDLAQAEEWIAAVAAPTETATTVTPAPA